MFDAVSKLTSDGDRNGDEAVAHARPQFGVNLVKTL
jgi:hypothetical protein